MLKTAGLAGCAASPTLLRWRTLGGVATAGPVGRTVSGVGDNVAGSAGAAGTT